MIPWYYLSLVYMAKIGAYDWKKGDFQARGILVRSREWNLAHQPLSKQGWTGTEYILWGLQRPVEKREYSAGVIYNSSTLTKMSCVQREQKKLEAAEGWESQVSVSLSYMNYLKCKGELWDSQAEASRLIVTVLDIPATQHTEVFGIKTFLSFHYHI